ncbi:formylglycine-generating enzyme family protein [Myxococcota bacterium]|nr:formylglycine-generating enzyme family protein [Myxococcota bacterium]
MPRRSVRSTNLTPAALVVALALVAGCAESVTSNGDASDEPRDAGALDAAALDPDTGASTEDATSDAGYDDPDAGLDAGDDHADAGSLDASPGDAEAPDSGWGGCSVDGVAGTCQLVSTCTGDQVATPGFCPGPADIQCCTPRGGTFSCDSTVLQSPNVGLAEEPGVGGCPAGMFAIPASPAFCIDRFEAALVELDADGNATPWSPYHHPGARRVRAVSLRDAVPQGYVDQRVATAACAEAGKRLCTDAEWLRACRGPSGTIYPYGDTRMRGTCNDARAQHPAVELFPNDPTPYDRIQDACINQLPDSLDHTGANAGCVSAEGAFDLMGNLHEWTSDPAGTFRGGFYVDTVINGNGCLYATTAHDVGHWDYSTGFRCCADAP